MQTATNPQTGEKVQWNGSSWIPLGGSAQPAMPAPAMPQSVTIGTPHPKTPDIPTGYEPDPAKPGAIRPIPGGPHDEQVVATPGDLTKTGDEYLATLPPGLAGQVKALADGRRAYPTGTALKDPKIQELIAAATQYDPTLDAANAATRVSTRRDFTSGQSAKNITAINTALGHLETLAQAADELDNFGHLGPLTGTANRLRYTFLEESGDPRTAAFKQSRDAVANELMRVFRQVGASTSEIEEWQSNISGAQSPDQLHQSIKTAAELLGSRLSAMNDTYQRGLGKSADVFQLLSPHSREVFARYGFGDAPDSGKPPSGGSPPDLPPDAVQGATGATKEVVDPNLTPVRREYLSMLSNNAAPGEVVAFLRKSGITDAGLLKSAAEQAAFRRKHQDIPLEAYSTERIDHVTQQMSGGQQALNAIGQSDLGAGIAAAGNAVTGNYLPDIIGATGGNAEQARLALQYSGQDHPGASLAGAIAGGTTAALGGEAALARGAGMAPGALRSLAADAGYGAVAGSGASPDNRLGGAALGAAAGAGGSLAGQALTRGVGATVRGVSNKDVTALTQEGVGPLTVGQAVGQSGRVGQLVKGVEDRLTGFAGPGTMINARRTEGVRSFNSKAFDKALEPIGAKVDGAVGEDAVGVAHQKVREAFSNALSGKTATPDEEFITAARGPMQRLASNKRVGPEIVQEIEATTQGLFDPKNGALSGENMQAFLDGLRQIRQGYKTDPLYQSLIKPSIQGVENAVEGMFKRQAPEVMPKFNAAKAAYRRLSILSDAVNRGKNTEGVFTPGQLGMADRGNTKKFNGAISAASGDSPFFDYQRSAQNVLPNKVPDSGTAGRLAMVAGHGSIPALGAGVGFLGGDTKGGLEGGLGLAGVLAALYTKRGQSFLVNALVKRSDKARAAGEAVKRLAPVGGAAGAALATPGQ